jgi:hypothetical protein
MKDHKTETELKLRDASVQISIALKNSKDDEVVRSCINSFISHGRSVTFVMQKESAQYPQIVKWYEETMSNIMKLPLMKFFNDKRIYTIHKGVITPQKIKIPVWNLTIDGVQLPGDQTITVLKFDGINDYLPGDSGNVFRLCRQYLAILDSLVAEWLKERDRLGI